MPELNWLGAFSNIPQQRGPQHVKGKNYSLSSKSRGAGASGHGCLTAALVSATRKQNCMRSLWTNLCNTLSHLMRIKWIIPYEWINFWYAMTTAYFHPQYWLMGSLHVSAYPCPSATVFYISSKLVLQMGSQCASPWSEHSFNYITNETKKKKKTNIYCTTRREVLQRLICDTIIVSTWSLQKCKSGSHSYHRCLCFV